MKIMTFAARKGAPRKSARGHAGNMHDGAAQLRSALRTMIRRYRLCQTAHEICEVKELYLQAEGQIRLDYIRRLLRLCREAQRDYAAMCRVGK